MFSVLGCLPSGQSLTRRVGKVPQRKIYKFLFQFSEEENGNEARVDLSSEDVKQRLWIPPLYFRFAHHVIESGQGPAAGARLEGGLEWLGGLAHVEASLGFQPVSGLEGVKPRRAVWPRRGSGLEGVEPKGAV